MPRTTYSEECASWMRTYMGNRTYRDVARQVGVSSSYVGEMVRGRVPSPEVVTAVARALGTSPTSALEAAGLRQTLPEPAVDLFWRRFGDAHGRLAREGIYLPAPTPDTESPAWQR